MSSFTAALFATSPRPMDNEQSLAGYALLFEGSRPQWEIHISDQTFHVIADPQHILEDGVWALCSLNTEKRTGKKAGLEVDRPVELITEFTPDELDKKRRQIPSLILQADVKFRLVNFGNGSTEGQEKMLADWQDSDKIIADTQRFLDVMKKELE